MIDVEVLKGFVNKGRCFPFCFVHWKHSYVDEILEFLFPVRMLGFPYNICVSDSLLAQEKHGNIHIPIYACM